MDMNTMHIRRAWFPLLLAAALWLTGCGGNAAQESGREPETARAAESAAPLPEQPPGPEATGTVAPAAGAAGATAADTTRTPETLKPDAVEAKGAETPAPERAAAASAAEPEPDAQPWTGPDLPEQPRAEDGFFADAAFFGNSLIKGLEMYGGLREAAFFGANSAAVYNVGSTLNFKLSGGADATMLDALGEGTHGKVYVLLGINEIALEPDYFVEQYDAVLDEITARQPEAMLYIMSLTPVTEKKSLDASVFTQERVLEYNDALHALAARRGCAYVDLVEALAGPDGFLAEEESTDGIHLTQETYPVWSEYLRTHYVPQT